MSAEEPIFREVTGRFGVLRLVVEVHPDGVHIRLAPLPPSGRRIAFDDIVEVAVATYSARTYGGWHWGVRTMPGGNTVYRVHGSVGVEIILADGRTVFVGSQRPDDLYTAITRYR